MPDSVSSASSPQTILPRMGGGVGVGGRDQIQSSLTCSCDHRCASGPGFLLRAISRRLRLKMESQHFLESNWSLMIFLNMINEFLAKPEIIMIRKNTDPWEEFTPCMRT